MTTTPREGSLHHGMLWTLVAGIFLGTGINFVLAMRTFILIDSLFIVFLMLGFLSLGCYYLFFRSNRRYFIEIVGVCFLGAGNLVLATLLTLNFLFHQPPVTTVYVQTENERSAPAESIIIHDSSYRAFPYLLHFEELEDAVPGLPIKEIRIRTAQGLLGYRVVLNREVVFQ